MLILDMHARTDESTLFPVFWLGEEELRQAGEKHIQIVLFRFPSLVAGWNGR